MMDVIELEAMAAMVDKAEEPITDECCIYRVPSVIRRFKEDAYIPSVVSIGPFHHNSHPPRLHDMERHKLSYCKAFLQRTNTASHDWIRYIQSVEPQFRRFYSETLEFSKEELVKIIFVDSTFIFELFCSTYHRRTVDVYPSKPWLDFIIRLDLLLLENQLPFSLLQDLFDKFFANRSYHNFPSLLELTFKYFECFMVIFNFYCIFLSKYFNAFFIFICCNIFSLSLNYSITILGVCCLIWCMVFKLLCIYFFISSI
uniref:UPF0481 protein At3g47200 family n=1 Tax=Cajanus cajan TaxID=3821 RepID=A0A151QV90_CAJCA|nr:UPF0481 protein At3g47200 family [Cajanus cajan]